MISHINLRTGILLLAVVASNSVLAFTIACGSIPPTEPPIPVDFLLLQPKTVTLQMGQSQQFTVIAYDRFESRISVPAVEWSIDPMSRNNRLGGVILGWNSGRQL